MRMSIMCIVEGQASICLEQDQWDSGNHPVVFKDKINKLLTIIFILKHLHTFASLVANKTWNFLLELLPMVWNHSI